MNLNEEIIKKITFLEDEVNELKTRELNRVSRLNVGLSGAGAGVNNIYADGNITASGYLKSQLDGSSYGLFLGQDTQLYRSAANVLRTPDTFVVDGDLYTGAAWQDYSATSTVTGWQSFTAKQIYYKQVGKLVFVAFNLNGASNNTVSSFTLPFTSAVNPAAWQSVHSGSDNGGAYAFGRAGIAGSSNTVAMYRDAGSTAWTNTGTKHIRGLIWFEIA